MNEHQTLAQLATENLHPAVSKLLDLHNDEWQIYGDEPYEGGIALQPDFGFPFVKFIAVGADGSEIHFRVPVTELGSMVRDLKFIAAMNGVNL